MKKFNLSLLLLCFCAPAFAQATYTIPLGGNWGIDSKLPIQVDMEKFNLQFQKHMEEVRERSQQTPAENQFIQPASVAREEAAQPAAQDPQDYTTCIVCREKIRKDDGFRLFDNRDWYVKKHSSCACGFFKEWQQKQDLSFVAQADKRQKCEKEMNAAYQLHTCAICGQPINVACGSVSTWTKNGEKHYAHADCTQKQRYEQIKTDLLEQLEVTEQVCQDFDKTAQLRQQLAQMQKENLVSNLQNAAQKIDVPTTLPPVPASPAEFKKVKRQFKRFMNLYAQDMQDISADLRAGNELSPRQQKLLERYQQISTRYNALSPASASGK